MPAGYVVGSTIGGWSLNKGYGDWIKDSNQQYQWYPESADDAELINPTNLITCPFF